MHYNLFTRYLVFALVVVLTVGGAVRGARLPIMSGLSAKTSHTKLRPKAILKNTSKTCQSTVKKSGHEYQLACCSQAQAGLTAVTPLTSSYAVPHRNSDLPSLTDRAPPAPFATV